MSQNLFIFVQITVISVDEVIDSMIASVASPGKPAKAPEITENLIQSTDENFQVQTLVTVYIDCDLFSQDV